ncbi:MAG: DUF1266 domain-containing protein [Alistipes sp.]|nr:DUF1266 domain-containing protein [Alistipes sp.]
MNEFFSRYYLVILVGVVVVVMALFNYLSARRRNAAGDGQTIRFNYKSRLNPMQYKRVSAGAVYSQQQWAYINSLETGLDREKVMNIVNNWWGIHSPEEAVAKLDYLDSKGFDYYFPTVFRAFMEADPEKQKEIITGGMVNPVSLAGQDEDTITEDVQKAFSQRENLAETYDELVSDGVIAGPADIERYGVVGWDCGRLNFLARLCYDAGFLTESQTWSYVDRAYDLAARTFGSWDEYARSYVIGRAMWGGAESDNHGITEIAWHLLKDPESPWVKMPLKD